MLGCVIVKLFSYHYAAACLHVTSGWLLLVAKNKSITLLWELNSIFM